MSDKMVIKRRLYRRVDLGTPPMPDLVPEDTEFVERRGDGGGMVTDTYVLVKVEKQGDTTTPLFPESHQS
jgi:hypothetical protein